ERDVLDGRRHVVLDPRKRSALLQALDFLRDVALEMRIHEVFRQALREALPRLARDRKLRDRIDRDRARGILGTLGLDVEPAQRLDRVAEQLDAQRLRGVRRKDVEDAAAKRELAGLADEVRSHESV